MLKWFKHSSIKVSLEFNPVQWIFIPIIFNSFNTKNAEYNHVHIYCRWLFLAINIIVDDGNW